MLSLSFDIVTPFFSEYVYYFSCEIMKSEVSSRIVMLGSMFYPSIYLLPYFEEGSLSGLLASIWLIHERICLT